jgi:hypothetical protein
MLDERGHSSTRQQDARHQFEVFMSRDHLGSRGDTGSKVATRLALLLCTDEEVHDLAEFWLTAAGMRVTSASSRRTRGGGC